MLPSNVNLFGNSSSFFTIHQLKKILRIPQDQLNKLNNIPGWSHKKTDLETSTTSPHKESKNNSKEKYSFNKQNCFRKSDSSNSIESVNIVSKKISNDIISEQEFLNSERPSLSKSKSLNFLNLETFVVSKNLKKSFSCPNMEKGLAQKTKMNYPFLPKKYDESDIPRNLLVEKSQFMDSAVQCKMSQSSQPIFEIPLSERIELLTVNKEKINYETFDDQSKTESVSKCEEIKIPSLPIASVLETASENKIEKKENAVERKMESSIETFKKNITNEESFVSQVVPCAQPCSVDNVQRDVDLTNDLKFPSVSNFNDASAVPLKSSEVKKPATKRKRCNKSEKDSKKLKSLGNIDIVYSSEQIKNMIEMMKTVFKKL